MRPLLSHHLDRLLWLGRRFSYRSGLGCGLRHTRRDVPGGRGRVRGGEKTLSVPVAHTIHVEFTPTTGSLAALTYRIYTVVGAFTAPTLAAVESEGTLAATVTTTDAVDI